MAERQLHDTRAVTPVGQGREPAAARDAPGHAAPIDAEDASFHSRIGGKRSLEIRDAAQAILDHLQELHAFRMIAQVALEERQGVDRPRSRLGAEQRFDLRRGSGNLLPGTDRSAAIKAGSSAARRSPGRRRALR